MNLLAAVIAEMSMSLPMENALVLFNMVINNRTSCADILPVLKECIQGARITGIPSPVNLIRLLFIGEPDRNLAKQSRVSFT